VLYALPSSFAPVLISTGGLTVRNDSQPALLLQRAMLRANKLAIRGLGLTTPNPIVGAVILDAEGKEVASGFHRGGDHAEVIAINGALAQGFSDFANATLVVTLEPCNHHGKTPPCVGAIIKAGFGQVVFAVHDPNPIAEGGAKALTAAGISVISGVEKEYVAYCNRAWLQKIKTGKPWVITKIATTLDGKVAAPDSTSQWITSAEARSDVAQIRNHVDAIVTTTATVLSDNPDLTPRFSGANPSGREVNPIRIVLGEREIPADAKIRNDRAETRFIHSRSFSDVMEMARAEGWNQVLVEAGSQFNSNLITSGSVDEILLYQAPSLLGQGKAFYENIAVATLTDRMDFTLGEVKRVGSDLRIQLLSPASPYAGIFDSSELVEGAI